MTAHNVHIVGSVPLPDAETTFVTLADAVGPYLRSMPDGETGARLDWIHCLEPVFANNPAFERADDAFLVHPGATAIPRYRLRRGVAAADLDLDNLLWADYALESWEVFSRLKASGAIPADCRFQVDLVPAQSPCRGFVAEADQETVEPIFNAALKREIDRIAAVVAADQLAIQFDIASAVFFNLERGEPTRYGETKAAMHTTFAREAIELGDHVPDGVALIYHLCYGDNNHVHSIEPTDMSDLVTFANNVAAAISRPIQLIHMPVPRGRSDDAYFAPLDGLALRGETEISLGLVHHTDGVEGTRRRMATAKRYLPDFSVATECGFGRRDPATLAELLDIHATIAEDG